MTIYGTSAAFRNGLTGTEEWTRINNEIKARNGNYGHQNRRSYEQEMRTSIGTNIQYDVSKGLVSVNSIKAPDHEPNNTGWNKVINGGYDAAIRSYVRSIPSGHKCYLIYNHEPENDGGSPQTLWRQAFARFAKVVLDCGNSNVIPTFNLMSYTWRTSTRNPDDYNPARHMTSAEAAACVGSVDAYTSSADTLFTQPRADILSWGFRGFGVGEMASNSVAASPAWMLDVEDWVDTHTKVEFVCYWHATTGPDTTYFLDQSESMLQTWADIIGRNQGASIPVSEVPQVELPASSSTGNATGTPVVGSGNATGYAGGGTGMFAGMYGANDGGAYTIKLGMFSGTEELANIDINDSIAGSGLLLANNVGWFHQGGAASFLYHRTESDVYPYDDSGLFWWFDWNGVSWTCRNPGNEYLQWYPADGVKLIKPPDSSYRPGWITSPQTMRPTADGMSLVALEQYVTDGGPPSNYTKYWQHRIRLYNITDTTITDSGQTVEYGVAMPNNADLPKFFMTSSVSVGDSVVWFGRYTGGFQPFGFAALIATVTEGVLELVEVDTHYLPVGAGFIPSASQKLIPVEGWTDKILVGYEDNFWDFDWSFNYFVLHTDGTISNVVSFPAYSVEKNDFYGDPYIDADSDSWLYISGGGIGGVPYAMYMKNVATGDPDDPNGPPYQTWTYPTMVQRLSYVGGVLSLSGDPVGLGVTTDQNYQATQDNEYPNFIGGGSAWAWKSGIDVGGGQYNIVLASPGPGGVPVEVAGVQGYQWYENLHPLGETPNLDGSLTEKRQKFARPPTDYTP